MKLFQLILSGCFLAVMFVFAFFAVCGCIELLIELLDWVMCRIYRLWRR